MKRERSDVVWVFRSSLLSGWFAFLSYYVAELILTYWLSGKLRPARFVYYFCTYVLIGTLFGLGTGTAHMFLTTVSKGRIPTKSEPLLLALNVSGFLCFLAIVVLNAHYLPLSPIVSAMGLALCLAIACISLLFLFLFYVSADRAGPCSTPYRTMSVCSSTAAALVVFQAAAAKLFGGREYSLSLSAALTLCFLATGFLAALADLKVTQIRRKGNGDENQSTRFKKIMLGKLIVFATIFIGVMIVRPVDRGGISVLQQRVGPSKTPNLHKPNIIFIVLDTVRQDRLSCYGCERQTTPNIDQFAEISLVFDAYSTTTWTLPSHAAIVTGLYPTENGTGLDSHNYIAQKNETIAEILAENGYSTAAVVANYLALGFASGFAQGFGYYYAVPRETDPVFPLVAHSFLRKFLSRSPASLIMPCQKAEEINREALRWLGENKQEPFFLFLNYMDAHTPYAAPPPFNRRWYYPPSEIAVAALENTYPQLDGEGKAGRQMVETERAHRLGQYDGEIAYLDSQLGVLFEKLKEIGVFDSSLIVLTSDHGEYIFEHGLLIHPPAVYQEAIRVPLIIKPPEGTTLKPGKMPHPVSLVDISPSVLEYVGISHSLRTGGSHLLEGESMPIFTEAHLLEGEAKSDFAKKFGQHNYSIILGDYKLIYSSNQTYELYDLASDPFEAENLFARDSSSDADISYSSIRDELSSRIERINAKKLDTRELSTDEKVKIQKNLKALGYIQ